MAAGQPSAAVLRGAIDLASLGATPAVGDATQPGGVVVAVTEASFSTEVLQRSMQVPVVVDFWATWCEPCKQLSPVLEKLAQEYAGQFVLATIDTDTNQQVAQAFGVQSIPSVFAVIKGQPVPLFNGAQPEAQVRQVLDEVLKVAAANGLTGRVEVSDSESGAESEQVEPELPPLHQQAIDAIDRDDLPAALAAYTQALAENPGDELARLGLAQTSLLHRTAGVDVSAVRTTAAADPEDVPAQLLAADVDVVGGHIDDAFGRLIELVRRTNGAERDRARQHLVELFEVVGDDIRVAQARTALANALF